MPGIGDSILGMIVSPFQSVETQGTIRTCIEGTRR
jgi:hypothetical protein